jgi:[protein-PII] uridylyltransferase
VGTAFDSAAGELPPDTGLPVAVVALGGYGRVELCPSSDVDLMMLVHDGAQRELVERFVTTFFHILWDAGLDVGHSVRRLGEVRDMHGKASPDVWASLLEGRYVCGDTALGEELQRIMTPDSTAGTDRWFLGELLEESVTRHERYGHSVKLLEPNVKKSAGGLRDYQSLLWLARATHPAMPARWDTTTPAGLYLLNDLARSGVIEEQDRASIESALEFLLRTRQQMHFLRRAAHDTLEYSLQREVAAGLGYGPAANPGGAEAFMRVYYRHARAIYRLHVRFMSTVRNRLDPGAPAHHQGEKLGALFSLHDDCLTIDPGVERFRSAGDLLEAFVHIAERDVAPDFRLARLIEQGAGLFTEEERSSPGTAACFRRILRARTVGPALQTMNDLGILGAYIPEFGDLVAFFQHSVYHFYTADEHTLIALGNAERLRERKGILHGVFRGLARKDVLYLAILLHDIGKPRGVADHEITGAEMAAEILPRIGMAEDLPAVDFLVRHHLLMEQTAFRRNIHDPDTVRDFSARIPSHDLLDALYLLTYADLSAVNSSVWTDWKASLLQELYLQASALVRGEAEEPDGAKAKERIRRLEDSLAGSIRFDEVRRHLQEIPNRAYLALFSDDEIGGHIRAGREADAVTTLIADREGYSEITVITRDAPFLLSHCCAVLSANDANIFDATVMTRDDGVIFDRFRVTAVNTGRVLDHGASEKIRGDMTAVLAGSLEIDRLFEAHRRRWRRIARAGLQHETDEVRLVEAGAYTIIDVYAGDSVGLLYRITEVMSRLGLDIHFAKIATRGDGVADAFYVRDREGKPLNIHEQSARVCRELLGVLATLANEELA